MARGAVRGAARPARNSDQRLTALYLDMLAAERGAGKNTLAAYGRDLADFTAYLAGARSSIAGASTDELRAYLSELARRGMTSATVARRLSAIRQLYRFLYAEGQRKDDPAAVLEGPKRARTLPKTLTLGEVDRLLRVAADAGKATSSETRKPVAYSISTRQASRAARSRTANGAAGSQMVATRSRRSTSASVSVLGSARTRFGPSSTAAGSSLRWPSA